LVLLVSGHISGEKSNNEYISHRNANEGAVELEDQIISHKPAQGFVKEHS
jgi:hypothetical protein